MHYETGYKIRDAQIKATNVNQYKNMDALNTWNE